MKKRIKNLINRYFNKLPTPSARCYCMGNDICVIDTYRLSASGYPYETFYDKDTGICYIAIGNCVEITLAGLESYSLFIRELNAIMDEMGIDNIERLKLDLNWTDFVTFS